MTVICPSCDARFRDPPASVDASHPLQCGKCEHQWAREPSKKRLKLPKGITAFPMVLMAKATPVAMAGAVAIALFAGAFASRDASNSTGPQTASVFEAMGFGDETPLEIANVTTTRTKQDGISKLVVRGEIANIADSTVPVPPIVLTMRGKGETPLMRWSVESESSSLDAGERSAFVAVASDYPSEATDLDVSFQAPKAN